MHVHCFSVQFYSLSIETQPLNDPSNVQEHGLCPPVPPALCSDFLENQEAFGLGSLTCSVLLRLLEHKSSHAVQVVPLLHEHELLFPLVLGVRGHDYFTI